MTRMARLATTLMIHAILAVGVGAGAAWAGNDPSIQGEERAGIQAAMGAFIDSQKGTDGSLLQYDPVTGKLTKLKLVELHEGIVKKGHFFVSCADFVDENDRPYDLDFLVVPKDGGFRVNQAIIHAENGEKRKYQVEQRWPGLF
ncbi:MAG: hypothetical protein GY723_17715 [bacterium]|nr:hypothetical protein [bacterium]MCP5069064.1 hypothetical protein [bacterium]